MPTKSLAIKNILFKSGLHPHSNIFSRGRHLAILRYHSLKTQQNNDYVSSKISLPVRLFEEQIQYLFKHYKIISMDDVANIIQNRRLFPHKGVVITFDDGYRDNYAAYQILKKYGVSGTFYVVAGCIGEGEPLWLFEIIYLIKNTSKTQLNITIPGQSINLGIRTAIEKNAAVRSITALIKSNDRVTREAVREQLKNKLSDVDGLEKRAAKIMLTWDQLREMSDNGMIIGGHTMTHLNLPNADSEDAKREITGCKQLLEEKLQKSVIHFSYPNGGDYLYYNQTILNMVKAAGYLTSTTSDNGLAELEADAYALRRVRVTPNTSEIYYQIEWEPLIDKFMNAFN